MKSSNIDQLHLEDSGLLNEIDPPHLMTLTSSRWGIVPGLWCGFVVAEPSSNLMLSGSYQVIGRQLRGRLLRCGPGSVNSAVPTPFVFRGALLVMSFGSYVL